jgi:hypothetical protein
MNKGFHTDWFRSIVLQELLGLRQLSLPAASKHLLVLLGVALASTSPVEAQRYFLHGGPVGYSTGDDANCADLPALGAGIHVQSRGAFFLRAGADLFQSLGGACTNVLLIIRYPEDRWAAEHSEVHLFLSPRIIVHGGYRFGIGTWSLDPAAGVGLLYSYDAVSEAFRLQPWRGLSVSLQPPGRNSLRLEVGQHRIPVEHRIGSADHQGADEVLRFHRYGALVQLSFQRRL